MPIRSNFPTLRTGLIPHPGSRAVNQKTQLTSVPYARPLKHRVGSRKSLLPSSFRYPSLWGLCYLSLAKPPYPFDSPAIDGGEPSCWLGNGPAEQGSSANGKLIPGGEGQRLLFVIYNLLFVSNCVLCISVGWQETRDLLLRV